MVAVADHIGSDFHQHLSPYGQSSVCHFFRQSVGHNFMLLTAAAAGIANFRFWLTAAVPATAWLRPNYTREPTFATELPLFWVFVGCTLSFGLGWHPW